MIKKISDKRKEKGERMAWNSTIKAKPYDIKRIAKKTLSVWHNCRLEIIRRFGNKCLLCGREEDIEIHHWDETRSRNPSRKYDLTNLVPLCSKCHKHNGNDARFFNLRERIMKKLKERKEDEVYNNGNREG